MTLKRVEENKNAKYISPIFLSIVNMSPVAVERLRRFDVKLTLNVYIFYIKFYALKENLCGSPHPHDVYVAWKHFGF